MKKNVKKYKTDKIYEKQRIIVSIVFVALIILISTGLIIMDHGLYFKGNNNSPNAGKLYLLSVNPVKENNVTDKGVTYTSTTKGENVYLSSVINAYAIAGSSNMSRSISYSYIVTNDSKYNYEYKGLESTSKGANNATINYPAVSGIKIGDVIKPGGKKNISITYTTSPSNLYGSYSAYTILSENKFIFTTANVDTNIESIYISAASSSTTINGTTAEIEVDIMSTYQREIEYQLTLSNSKLVLVDNQGNPSNYYGKISSGDQTSFKIYVELASNTEYKDILNTYINVVTSDFQSFQTTNSISVDKHQEILEEDPNVDITNQLE